MKDDTAAQMRHAPINCLKATTRFGHAEPAELHDVVDRKGDPPIAIEVDARIAEIGKAGRRLPADMTKGDHRDTQ